MKQPQFGNMQNQKEIGALCNNNEATSQTQEGQE